LQLSAGESSENYILWHDEINSSYIKIHNDDIYIRDNTGETNKVVKLDTIANKQRQITFIFI